VTIFAREGFDAASANRIAQAADVVNGTFYLHFKDKDEIIAAVVFGIMAEIIEQLNQEMSGIEDAVEWASLRTRRLVEFAGARPEWGWALSRAASRFQNFRDAITGHLKSNLERGVRQGAFTVEVGDFLIDAMMALTQAAILRRLQGVSGAEAGSEAAELQLRMLGVAAKKAHKVAWRKLPPLAFAIQHADLSIKR
jgi:AcrR family transcriptional regulator